MKQKRKVFIVEDMDINLEGLIRIIEQTKDLLYKGCHNRNSDDLPDRIIESGADIVIVDVVLGKGIPLEDLHLHPKRSGLAAIKAIREKLGQKIKILGCSVWPKSRELALKAGADGFFFKEATSDEVLNVIRQVIVGGPPKAFTKITGLELFPTTRTFVVIGNQQNEHLREEFSIKPFPFAFFYYLAMERKQGQKGWVLKEDSSFFRVWARFEITKQFLKKLEAEGVPNNVVTKLEGLKNREFKGDQVFLDVLKEMIGNEQTVKFKSLILKHAQNTLWLEISSKFGSIWGSRDHIEAPTISRWCSIVNTLVSPYFNGAQSLIKVPDKRDFGTPCSLNIDISKENILIQD